MICVITGSLTIFAFSNFNEVTYTVDEIKELLSRTSSKILLIGYVVFFFTSLVI